MAKIGKLYKVNLHSSNFEDLVTGASKDIMYYYPRYGDLQGKVVMVLAKEDATLKLGLTKKGQPIEGYWFYLLPKWLMPLDPYTCSCDIKVIMCRGCQCGVFLLEKQEVFSDNTVIF